MNPADGLAAASLPSPSPSAIRRVGLVSPGWPAGALANGIVTYVANIRAGLQAIGVGSAVIANTLISALDAADDRDVVDASLATAPLSLRAVWKAQERIAGMSTLDRRLGFAVATALREAHRRDPLDLFELEESLGAPFYVQGAIPRPMVVRLHGPWCLVSPALGRPDPEADFQQRVLSEGRAIAAAAAVSSPSRHALDGVKAKYGFDLADAVVIPNPIAIQPEGARWRIDDCDKKTVLFVGRFDRLKGGDVVLRAFARLLREVADARLVFVGPDRGLRDDAGRDWSFDQYLRAHLPGEAAARVEMLGERPAGEIAALRRRSFLTMVASRFETFSMTTVEGLSFGCPVVAPAAAAIREIIEHDRTGLLFKDSDDEDAAAQLLRIFRDPPLAQRLAAAGCAEASRRFAPEIVARQMVAFYDRVLAKPAGNSTPLDVSTTGTTATPGVAAPPLNAGGSVG